MEITVITVTDPKEIRKLMRKEAKTNRRLRLLKRLILERRKNR